MRLIIYFFLMLLAIIFDVVQVVSYWGENRILLISGIFVLLITLFLAFLHMGDQEDWRLRWMLLYTIPAALIVFGSLAGLFDLQNQGLMAAGQRPVLSVMPGTPSDYEGAVISHFASMTFPFFARALSAVIGNFIDMAGLKNRRDGLL